ncbi:MAG: hypothetical protein FWE24_07345 [Defluviitaleaceae bacterium]|nr:hypothetical protein [Defluviitaleaceae bacterium]
MAKKTNNGLPTGVSAVKNRPNLYRLEFVQRGKRHSEYYSCELTAKKELQSELQKAIDNFRERVESGSLKGGDINAKSTFTQAVEWFAEIRKLDTREST